MTTITTALGDLGLQILRHSSPALPLYDALEPSHVFILASILDRVRPVLPEVSRDHGAPNSRFDFWGPGIGGGEALYGEAKQAWIESPDSPVFGDGQSVAAVVTQWADDAHKLNNTSDRSKSVHCAFVLFVYGKGVLPPTLDVGHLPTTPDVPRLSWGEAENWCATLSRITAQTAVGAVNELVAVALSHSIRAGSALHPAALCASTWTRPGEYGGAWLLPLVMEWIREAQH